MKIRHPRGTKTPTAKRRPTERPVVKKEPPKKAKKQVDEWARLARRCNDWRDYALKINSKYKNNLDMPFHICAMRSMSQARKLGFEEKLPRWFNAILNADKKKVPSKAFS